MALFGSQPATYGTNHNATVRGHIRSSPTLGYGRLAWDGPRRQRVCSTLPEQRTSRWPFCTASYVATLRMRSCVHVGELDHFPGQLSIPGVERPCPMHVRRLDFVACGAGSQQSRGAPGVGAS